MNNLKDVEQAIKQLSSEELAAFRAWFAEEVRARSHPKTTSERSGTNQ